MYRIILIVFPVLILFSCKHVTSNDHLPTATMQKILLDINLAEAYSVNIKDSVHRGSIKNTDSLSGFYQTIFNHYKITPEEFKNSLEWYKGHPEELDSVYNKMIPVVARWQVKTPEPKPAVKVDSTLKPKPDTAIQANAHISSNKIDTIKKKRFQPTHKNKTDSTRKKK